ncbi:hypothetical protein [Nocardia stercoris]|uniref:hypothetical protein n=1 Tax=Nocardia stercoris TaxID=2483361 RepID=UPI0011C3E81B|nr:hypothetical protein [Nocardia stercoris]
MVAVLAILAVVLLVPATGAAALWWFSSKPVDTGAISTTTSSAPSTTSARPSTSVGAVALSGKWTGSYTCSQGRTALELDITSDAAADIEAVFTFGPTADNSAVPAGSFAMRGTLSGQTLSLTGDHWIQRPPGWVMVGLSAAVNGTRPQSISGSVVADGCTTFSITRDPV